MDIFPRLYVFLRFMQFGETTSALVFIFFQIVNIEDVMTTSLLKRVSQTEIVRK